MPIVVMGGGLPSVIREDEGQPLVIDALESADLRVVVQHFGEELSKPEPVRKRRRGGPAES